MAMCSVRGMGVAESVRTSTDAFKALIWSLCFTPNRCSSSITSILRRPYISGSRFRSECVPTITCVSPRFHRAITSLRSLSFTFRVMS